MENTVKQRLIAFLKYKGLSQKRFADAVGVSSGYVNAIRQSIQPETLHKIAICYPDLDTGWLITGEGSMIKPQNITGNVNSVVNSKNFNYEKGGSITAADFLAFAKESQRQIGELIDTISVLSKKIQ